MHRVRTQVEEKFEEAVAALPRAFPRLETLRLGAAVTDEDLAHLRHLAGLPQGLRRLSLNGCSNVTDDGLRHVAQLTRLQGLDVSGTCMTWQGLLHLVQSLPALRSLSMDGCNEFLEEVLVMCLTDPSDAVREGAAAALAHRAADPHDFEFVPAIVEAVGVPPLVALLADGPGNAPQHAAATLGRIALYSEHCDAVIEAGALPRLVAQLSLRSIGAAQQAAATLERLAGSSSAICDAIVSAGGLQPLVALLAREQLSVAVQALSTLSKMAADSDARCGAMLAAGCLAPLFALLRRPDWTEGGLWVTAMRFFVHLGIGCVMIREAMVSTHWLGSLIQFTKDSAPKMASKLLARVAAGGEAHCSALIEAGGLPPLAKLLRGRYNGSEAVQRALEALHCLATGSDAHYNAVAAAGCLPALAALMQDGSGAVVTAAQIVCELAHGSEAQRDGIVAAGCLPALADRLSHSDAQVAAQAAHTLVGLLDGKCNARRDAVIVVGCLPPLAKLLVRTPECAQNAALSLMGLADGGESYCSTVVAADCLGPLTALLSHAQPNVAANATAALARLASSDACRDAIVVAGSLPPLVALLSHEDARVARNAAIAVRCLTLGSANAELRRLRAIATGVLPALRRLRKRKLADCAAAAGRALEALKAFD